MLVIAAHDARLRIINSFEGCFRYIQNLTHIILQMSNSILSLCMLPHPPIRIPNAL